MSCHDYRMKWVEPTLPIGPTISQCQLVGTTCPHSVLPFLLVQEVSAELYGPLMLTLTLVAVLLYGMKTSGHEVVSSTHLLDRILYGGGGGRGKHRSLFSPPNIHV